MQNPPNRRPSRLDPAEARVRDREFRARFRRLEGDATAASLAIAVTVGAVAFAVLQLLLPSA